MKFPGGELQIFKNVLVHDIYKILWQKTFEKNSAIL